MKNLMGEKYESSPCGSNIRESWSWGEAEISQRIEITLGSWGGRVNASNIFTHKLAQIHLDFLPVYLRTCSIPHLKVYVP